MTTHYLTDSLSHSRNGSGDLNTTLDYDGFLAAKNRSCFDARKRKRQWT